MVSSEQQFGWLGQSSGEFFLKMSIRDIHLYAFKNNKKTVVYFFNFIFITRNSNWLYTKPMKVQGGLETHAQECDSCCIAARMCSLEGTSFTTWLMPTKRQALFPYA
jgi:hypothetical protein